MNKAIRAHDLRVTVKMVLLAVLLLLLVALVFVLQPRTTTSTRDGNPSIHAMSGTRGSSFTHDPYIDRHAEVVARYHEGSLR
jgi:hypothetical protein